MKSTKIILGAIALVVTSAGSMAFRATSKLNGTTELFTDISAPCHLVACFTLPTGSANPHKCSSTVTYFTQVGTGSACANVWGGLVTATD